jgi:hypothetical protein
VHLVAHDSGARFVATVRDKTALLIPFSDGRSTDGPLADALSFADQTTGANARSWASPSVRT